MLNDRNDMPDDHEENEYHFSDEDVSYEVETESSKPASALPKESVVKRLGQSKRMLISLGVFLVLVFVVYKLVTPSSTTVATDISAPITTADQTNASSQSMQQQVSAQAPQAAAPVQQAQQNPMPVSQPETAAPAIEVAVSPPAGVAPPVTQPAVATMSPAPPASTPVQESAPQQQAVASMPAVIAVQQPPTEMNAPPSAPPSGVANQQLTTTTTTTNQPVTPVASQAVAVTPVDAATAHLTETNERLMTQLQSDYTQKFNDYATQNKMLQDQMQSLSARVSTMEAQLTQLVQALTPNAHQTAAPAPTPIPPAPIGSLVPPKPVIPVPEVKIAYSVQAIIPGRAWLRSESGEAVTVAEGDTIKDLGRVTKIDPYDGVVEVNTGSRSVSLSYGNGND